MSLDSEYRRLGMDRGIPRRDFLNGLALGVAGACSGLGSTPLAASQASRAPLGAVYPPALTGLRGQYPEAVASYDAIDRADARFPPLDVDTNEHYDLVVVGGGISGLSAAYFWRRALGSGQRILVLDNHDDFGGHAKRNEFQYEGRTVIGYGGTQSISTPYPYSFCAKALLTDLGIRVERNAELSNRGIFDTYHLAAGTFFDKEHFGTDCLAVGTGRIPWPEFFTKAPLTERARRDLVRIYTDNPDYMPGVSIDQKTARLARMSYQDYLLNVAGMTPDALPFFLGMGGRNNKRVDTTPALEAARRGSPGFNGLGLELPPVFREGDYTMHFPDGNATIARLLVSRLAPKALPGQHDMDSILNASLDYARLDEEEAKVRVRLRSTVLRVEHDAVPERAGHVRVAYIKEGRVHGVRGDRCVLACDNARIPGIMPELPAVQKEALCYGVKVPMMYNNVLVRRWTAFEKLGVASISAPCMYHTSSSLDLSGRHGGYRGITTPQEPAIIHMVRNPNKPGLPRREQQRAGQQELLSTSFEGFELEIRRQLARMLGPGGFDPATDIVGITVNRWPYGYAYTYDTLADPDLPPEQRPHVIGRQRCGRVTIANADAGAAAFTNQAIDEAHRAVQELLVAEGLT